MSLPSFPHLPAEAWRLHLDDALEGAARARMEAHLDECADCCAIFVAADPSRAFRMLREPPPAETWDGFWEELQPELAAARPRRMATSVMLAALAAAASVAAFALALGLGRGERPVDPCAAPALASLELTRAECDALFSGEIQAEEKELIVVRELDLRELEP